MKSSWVALLLAFGMAWSVQGSENLKRARQMEESGDAMSARNLLANAAQRAPRDVTALSEYAEFLDSYGDVAAKEAYDKLLAALDQPSQKEQDRFCGAQTAGLRQARLRETP